MIPYKMMIDDSIVEEQFKGWFGDEFTLEIDARYQHELGKTKVDIIFTKDNQALWIMKYKGKYYGHGMQNIEESKFIYIDIYSNFVDNAKETITKLKND